VSEKGKPPQLSAVHAFKFLIVIAGAGHHLVDHHFWSAVEAAVVGPVVGQLNCVAAAARSQLPEAVGADIDPVSNCLLRVVFAAYEFFYHVSLPLLC